MALQTNEMPTKKLEFREKACFYFYIVRSVFFGVFFICGDLGVPLPLSITAYITVTRQVPAPRQECWYRDLNGQRTGQPWDVTCFPGMLPSSQKQPQCIALVVLTPALSELSLFYFLVLGLNWSSRSLSAKCSASLLHLQLLCYF